MGRIIGGIPPTNHMHVSTWLDLWLIYRAVASLCMFCRLRETCYLNALRQYPLTPILFFAGIRI